MQDQAQGKVVHRIVMHSCNPPQADLSGITSIPDANVAELPPDALLACFRLLDWKSLCQCSCVCRAWKAWADEQALWQQQLEHEYYRPTLLHYYSQLKPSGGTVRQGTAADHGILVAGASIGTIDPAAASTEVTGMCAHGFSITAASSSPKQLFASSLAHPAATHQALLSRFHEAMVQVRGWRLLIKQSVPSVTSAAPSTVHNQVSAVQTSQQQQAQEQCSRDSQCSSSSSNRLTGYPAPLTWHDLQSGTSWCIGCVQQQQQEQSCWVRFHLPRELKQDDDLAQAAGKGLLTATIQALGPTSVGWFDVITSAPFRIAEDDMDILIQSHKTGFYAWDQAGEDAPDMTGDAEPHPWCVDPAGTAAAPIGAAPRVSSKVADAESAVLRSQQQEALQGAIQQSQDPHQEECKLRMLVYIHYEQLLQMLPWEVLQSVPLPPQQQQHERTGIQAAAQHVVAHKAAAMWLHIDVCQLHGGFRLGSCVAPLKLARMGSDSVEFEAQQDRVLVALYDPECSKNNSTAAASCSSAAAAAAVSHTQQHSSQSGFTGRSVATAQPLALRSAADKVTSAAADIGCKLLFVGQHKLLGGSETNSEGGMLSSAADVLQDLLSRDEVMVDFGLFDGNGHLLMGRAGVEVWSKEKTSLHTVEPPAVPAAAPGAEAQHQHGGELGGAEMMPAPVIIYTRTVHLLHFLIDGVDSRLWENGISFDAARAPDGVAVHFLCMRLTWPALKGLFGGVQQQHAETDDVGAAMQVMLDALDA